jgi:hypothetical protein
MPKIDNVPERENLSETSQCAARTNEQHSRLNKTINSNL